MRIFVLEDDPQRIAAFKQYLANAEDVTICRDIDQALSEFEGPYDVVFLDHDLGDKAYMGTWERNTGSEFIRQKGAELAGATVIIHSWNEPGARYMEESLLFNNHTHVYRAPFGPGVLQFARHASQQAA